MTSREFIFQGQKLIDPDPSMSVDDVRELYSYQHPELLNAVTVYPDNEGGSYEFKPKDGTKSAASAAVGGTQRVEFKTSVGRKG